MQNSKPAKANKKKDVVIVTKSSFTVPTKATYIYNKTHTTSEYKIMEIKSTLFNKNKTKVVQ